MTFYMTNKLAHNKLTLSVQWISMCFNQPVPGNLVPCLTESSRENASFRNQIDPTQEQNRPDS